MGGRVTDLVAVMARSSTMFRAPFVAVEIVRRLGEADMAERIALAFGRTIWLK
jgi:hypothetical protein